MPFSLASNVFLQTTFLGNTLKQWTIALVAFLALLIFFKIIKIVVLLRFKKLAKKTQTDIDDVVVEILETLRPPFYFFLAFYLAINFLVFADFAKKVVNAVLLIWVVFQIVKALQIIINYIAKKKVGEEGDRNAKAAIGLIQKLTVIILWIIGGLLVLQNLGFNINSLLAGLGIGGIAVALAAQNILGDLFSSFSIYFDKPFVVGDFIIVGKHMGVVEKIGIKTTRIRALQGEEIVISNTELTSSRIQNFKKMRERRVAFTVGVVYDTANEKLKKIPAIIENIIRKIDGARFDRAHFNKFDESSLTFEIVYYVKTGDYLQYMNIQQEINLQIKAAFEKEHIVMAYPTRTIYLEKSQ